MRRIANTYVSKLGKKLIKSTETVRSWGRCRNKRSRQAKQHRGKNLWSYARSQKKLKQRHVKVHYNRAHIKNYTRLAFGKDTMFGGLAVRRALDDKAYVRCGTSEGFSRPLHRPLQVSEDAFDLPSSDYPDTVGYVSPGVILLVNEMKEVEYKERDKFTLTDCTVTVTCKPKHIYQSTATNWQNDLFSVRYLYRDEHEVKTDATVNCCLTNLPERNICFLLWLRDSLLQYELMGIPGDIAKVVEGGDHLRREQLRTDVLQKRTKECLESFTDTDVAEKPILQELFKMATEVQDRLHDTCKYSYFTFFFTFAHSKN